MKQNETKPKDAYRRDATHLKAKVRNAITVTAELINYKLNLTLVGFEIGFEQITKETKSSSDRNTHLNI